MITVWVMVNFITAIVWVYGQFDYSVSVWSIWLQSDCMVNLISLTVRQGMENSITQQLKHGCL